MDILEVLDQKKVWFTADRTPVRIKDMSRTHLDNTIRWLERRAEHLAWHQLNRVYAIFPSEDSMSDGVYSVFHQAEAEADAALADPRRWLDSKPLMRRLRKEQRRRYKALARLQFDEPF